MGFYKQFEYFDPQKGSLTDWRFPQASSVIYRARSIIRNRSRDEIFSIAEDADQIISAYFDQEKQSVLDAIKSDGRYDLLEGDEDRITGFKDEAADHYDVRNSENTSDLDALQEAMTSLFDPTLLEIEGLKEYEYFAVLALWLIGDFIQDYEHKYDFSQRKYIPRERNSIDAYDTAKAAKHLIDAMESVCYAEKLRDIERLEIKYQEKIEKIQAGKAIKIDKTDLDGIMEDLRKQIQSETQERRKEQSIKNNDIRHQTNRQIKKLVQDQFAQDPRRFNSAEKAARHFVDVLEKQGVSREQRTVATWIRETAKANGIRFR